MAKVSTSNHNSFCPQTLFLYGTYKADGTPNFGLFCWFSYIYDDALGVMACIGGSKQTKDRIRENKMFSANLVNAPLLPLADYFGTVNGYDAHKMDIDPAVIPGAVLDVPILADSPVSFELEVMQEIPLKNSDVFLCRIRNVMMDEELQDENRPLLERLQKVQPAFTTCQTYFSANAKMVGPWGGVHQTIRATDAMMNNFKEPSDV